jgi:hypothetical protein
MATLKITGVDEEVVCFVGERSSSLHFKGQAEYLRNLIREDMLRAAAEKKSRLEHILAPLHAHADAKGYSDEELADVFERARNEVASIRSGTSAPDVNTIK